MTNELKELAMITINELQRDKMIDKFVAANEEGRINIALAYAIAAVKRYDKFATKVRTNPGFARYMALRVLASF